MHKQEQMLPCVGNEVWFFPLPGEQMQAKTSARRQVARWLCSGCPVRSACSELGSRVERAVEDRDYSSRGVWGGLERAELLNLPWAM